MFVPDKIFIEDAVKDLPLTRQIIEKCSRVPCELVPSAKEFIRDYQERSTHQLHEKNTLLLCHNKGRFLEPCPGTRQYLCCGYTILNIGTGCPLRCSYCVLLAYLNNPFITIYANLHDMWDELAASPQLQSKSIIRIGTGEYGDSLALEHLTGFVPAIAAYVRKQKGTVLELKTKTTAIEPLIGLDHGGSIIVSWSLNAEELAQTEETGAAPVISRIKAARTLIDEGYRIGFHFDPLIYYPGWEHGYKEVVDCIAHHIPPQHIAWISLGSLRYMPSLKSISRKAFNQSRIFAEEFVPGLDGKMRYFQKIRIEMYTRLVTWLRDYSPHIFIYLCMESPIVWEKSLGFVPSSNRELKRMLDERIKR